MRYDFPARVVLLGDSGLASRYIGEARALLGELMHDLREAGQRSGKRNRKRKDLNIDVSYDGTLAQIRIQVGPPGAGGEENFDIWIPQGFIVEPANNSAKHGWGLPTTAEDANAINPGPTPTNWTVDGPQPQVLLSTLPNAGYPKREIISLAMYYDSPEKQGDFKLPDLTDNWAAYRASFYDVGVDALAVIAAINATRNPAKPLVPPYFGYSQLAAWYQRLTNRYGFVDADMPQGSNTFYKRVMKDGTALEVATSSPVGSIGAVDITGLTDPGDIADALMAALPALSNDTLLPLGTTFALSNSSVNAYLAAIDQNEQWVRCGNIDWQSIHPEIPRLSWFGSRGRSIPSYELGCGVVYTTVWNGTPSPGAAFSSYLLDESNTFFYDKSTNQFDRFVYARGRVLAQLPNSGYCLGAAVQKIDATDSTPLVYRLIVIAWHRADQKWHEVGEPTINVSSPHAACWDTTSDIRVWYADLPERNGLACAPDRIVDDLYNATTNPTGWQAFSRHRITLADTDDSRSYWFGTPPENGGDYSSDHELNAPKGYFQTWMFNGSGTEATCIRSAANVVRIGGSLFATQPFGPMQAIKCSVTDSGSSISLAWHAPNGNIFDFGERWPIAWDYRGDDEVVAYFGSEDGSAAGTLRIEDTNGNALESWILLAQGWMAFAFDARSNSAILASYTIISTGVGSELRTGAIDIDVFHNSSLLGSQHIVVGADPGVGTGYEGWGRIDGYAYGPIWRDAYGHGDVMPALAVFGDDIFASYWTGATPGSRQGASPPYDARADYAFVGSAILSSIDNIGTKLGVDGWSNFAGVV